MAFRTSTLVGRGGGCSLGFDVPHAAAKSSSAPFVYRQRVIIGVASASICRNPDWLRRRSRMPVALHPRARRAGGAADLRAHV
jgi:hypothetical protein